MATRNPITGDSIRSKPTSDQFRDNFDAIFRKDKPSRIDEIGQNGNNGDHYDVGLQSKEAE